MNGFQHLSDDLTVWKRMAHLSILICCLQLYLCMFRSLWMFRRVLIDVVYNYICLMLTCVRLVRCALTLSAITSNCLPVPVVWRQNWNFSFIFYKMGQPRPLFRLFSVFSNKQYIFSTNQCEKISIQYMALGFKPTTFRTWVVTRNH